MNGCTVSFLLYDFIDTAILINGIDRTQNIVTAMASNDNSIVGAVQTLYGTWIKWFSFGKCLSCINPMHTRITQRTESLGRCCSNVSQRLFRWNFLTAIRRKSRCHYIGWLFIVFFFASVSHTEHDFNVELLHANLAKIPIRMKHENSAHSVLFRQIHIFRTVLSNSRESLVQATIIT